MRISDLRTVCFTQPAVPIHQKRFSGPQEIVLTSVTSEDGVRGYSMARAHGGQAGRGIADAIVSTLKPRVIGQDALDRERIWQSLTALEPAGYVPVFAISAVDVAIWDLVARSLALPLHKLLGGRSDRILAYASSANHERVESTSPTCCVRSNAATAPTRSILSMIRRATSRCAAHCAARPATRCA